MAFPKLHSWAELDDDLLIKILEASVSCTSMYGPFVSNLRLVNKHWCQAAGRCRMQLYFRRYQTVSRDSQLGTLLARSFSGVSTVSIRGDQTSAEAIESLGQLPQLTSLSFYDYSGPGITAAHFTRLQSLTLHDTNHLRANWLPASVPHLQGLTEFILKGSSHSISGADLGSLSKLSSLRALWLEERYDLQEACSILSCLILLTRLGMTSSLLLDEYLTGLQVLTGLEVLDLSMDPGDAYLYCSSCKPILTDSIVPTIAGLHRLQHLDLSGSNLTDAAMPHIALLTNLQELALDSCANIGTAGLQQLKGLTQLKISNLQADVLREDEHDDTSESSLDFDIDSCVDRGLDDLYSLL